MSRQETSFIRRMTYVLQMGAQYGEQRSIYDETGQVVDIIEPISAENVNIIEQPVIRTRDSHIADELMSYMPELSLDGMEEIQNRRKL